MQVNVPSVLADQVLDNIDVVLVTHSIRLLLRMSVVDMMSERLQHLNRDNFEMGGKMICKHKEYTHLNDYSETKIYIIIIHINVLLIKINIYS